jgi:hypothetical protein
MVSKCQILFDGKARAGEKALRTLVREHFSTTISAAIGQKMVFRNHFFPQPEE